MITRLFSDLSDKLIFALGLLTGLQWPNFLAQYKQRLGGHLNEAQRQLSDFQSVADKYFNGDITQLIEAHLSNELPAFVMEGEVIQANVNRVEALAKQLQALDGSLLDQTINSVTTLDIDIAQATLENLVLSAPITASALICGAVVALIFSGTTKCCIYSCKHIFRKKITV